MLVARDNFRRRHPRTRAGRDEGTRLHVAGLDAGHAPVSGWTVAPLLRPERHVHARRRTGPGIRLLDVYPEDGRIASRAPRRRRRNGPIARRKMGAGGDAALEDPAGRRVPDGRGRAETLSHPRTGICTGRYATSCPTARAVLIEANEVEHDVRRLRSGVSRAGAPRALTPEGRRSAMDWVGESNDGASPDGRWVRRRRGPTDGATSIPMNGERSDTGRRALASEEFHRRAGLRRPFDDLHPKGKRLSRAHLPTTTCKLAGKRALAGRAHRRKIRRACRASAATFSRRPSGRALRLRPTTGTLVGPVSRAKG